MAFDSREGGVQEIVRYIFTAGLGAQEIGGRRSRLGAMDLLLRELEAFVQEHSRCGELDGGVEGEGSLSPCCGGAFANQYHGNFARICSRYAAAISLNRSIDLANSPTWSSGQSRPSRSASATRASKGLCENGLRCFQPKRPGGPQTPPEARFTRSAYTRA